MKESRLFPDLPQSADPRSPKDSLINNPDYHHAVFGLAEQLNEPFPGAAQSEQGASTLAEASIALNAVEWWLLISHGENDSKPYLTQKAYEATRLPTTSLSKALELSATGAESLNTLTSLLYHEQTTPGEPTPGIDWLSARQYPPDEARVLMQGLRDKILFNIGSVSESLANVLIDLFSEHDVVHLSREIEDKALELVRQDESRIPPVEQLRLAIKQNFKGVPQVDVGNLPAGRLLRSVMANYRVRQRVMAELPPQVLPDRENPQNIEQSVILNIRPEPAQRPPEYMADETAQQIANLRDEIAELIRLHRERAVMYRGEDMSAWIPASEFKKLLERQELLVRNNSDPELTDRIVDLMLTFSELGSRSSEPHEVVQLNLERQLTEFFTFERAVGANLKKGAGALKIAGATSPLTDWEPVEADVMLLSKHWRRLLPTIRESWPEGDGQEVATAITNVLRAFDVYRKEIADPAGRLKAIATHLGATVLRPEHHPKAANLDPAQRRNAIANLLEDIASDEQLFENTRYRAEVLKHFIAGDASAESQGSQPAELFYFPPTREQSVSYFGVKGKKWVLLESLDYGRASYVFPQELVEKESENITPEALADFLNRHSKTRLVQNGGIQVIHTPGWTPQSHIQSITEKTMAADSLE